jgi:hypothetical protein
MKSMSSRSMILGSAGLSLAAILLAMQPGFAQYAGNPPQESTPAERAQTQQLNAQNAQGTDQSPAALNGEAPMQAQSEPSGAQQQYDAQRAQYEQDQQNYQDQQDRYRAQRHQYVRDLRRYDLARYEWTDYPRVYVYAYGDHRVRSLDLIADPTHQLASLPVEGPSGRFVGKIRNVELNPSGRPLRVEVALNRAVSVWVSPGHLRFDPDNQVVYTDLDRDRLWTMPPATVESMSFSD